MFSRVTVHTLTRRTYVRKYLSFQHENINLRILIFTQRSIAYLIPYVRIYKVIIVYIYIFGTIPRVRSNIETSWSTMHVEKKKF